MAAVFNFLNVEHIYSALQDPIVISWLVVFCTMFPSLSGIQGEKKKLKSFEKTQRCGCFFPKDKF